MKKNFYLLAAALVFSITLMAQAQLPGIDKSPLDLCYYPLKYPSLKVQENVTQPPVARVLYSRPKKEGRAIFGGLVEYGKLWRLGANEATEIEFYKPVMVGGKKIPRGRYTLYAIVMEKAWTFILNRETDVWGSFKYDPSKDVARVESPVDSLQEPVESLAMTFEENNTGIELVVAWEQTKVTLPIVL